MPNASLDHHQFPLILAALQFAACSAAKLRLSGRIGLRVHGRNGGTWVIDLTKSHEGARPADERLFAVAETRISGFATAFEDLLADPAAAFEIVQGGGFCVDGDRRVLKVLGTHLRPIHQKNVQ